MTVKSSIDPARLLEEQLAQARPDLLRELPQTFINALLSAEADSVCGAEYGTVSPDRVNRRNGYRQRDFDTRAGTLDVAIPKLRTGSYFPQWLLQRRKRAERALTSVATCYLLGVSTRRMDKLVQSLGITTLSKSQVSEMAKRARRPRRGVPYPVAGRVRSVHVRGRRRTRAQGPRGWSCRRSRARGDRCRRRRASAGPRPAGHLQRRRRRVAAVLPRYAGFLCGTGSASPAPAD